MARAIWALTVLLCAPVAVRGGTTQGCGTTLYGVSHPSTLGSSTLQRIDPDTGAATIVGGINFNGVGGIDFHPKTGVLYGVGKRVVTGANVLLTIDPATGVGTEVGLLVNAGVGGTQPSLFDLSFRSDGTLFLTAFDAALVAKAFTVNLATGLATPVGSSGAFGSGNAVGFTLSDSLFEASTFNGNTFLYRINQATGAASLSAVATYVGFPGAQNVYRLHAMDVEPSSSAPFVVVRDGTDGLGPTSLGSLNVRTGRIDYIGPTTAGMDALAWQTGCDDADPCTADACARCEDAVLYGAAYGAPHGPATLYQIDPVNGAAVAVGPIGFGRVGAMDFDEVTGILYATGERSDGSHTNVLLRIDPDTGAGTEVGPTNVAALGFGDLESDLSIRHADGRLYAYVEVGDGVVTINPTTGAASAVGSCAASLGNGMEFSRGDVLYQAGSGSLATLHQSTGAKSPVAPLGFVGFPPLVAPRINAMDVSCAGTVFASVEDGGGSGSPAYLATLDLASGVVTHLGLSVAGLDALAWRTTHGFCRSTFVDTDSDAVCDVLDCAPANPTAFALPGEVTITSVEKTGLSVDFFHTAAGGGAGTVHDAVVDLLTHLPVGPGGGDAETSSCGEAGTFSTIALDPGIDQAFWLVLRGRNACGPGSYGPPLNAPPRVTASCP